MKKLILFLFLLIPINVFALEAIDFDLVNRGTGSFIEINSGYNKLSNTSISYTKGVDFNTSSISTNYDYVMIPIYFDIYYLYTNNYSQDWSEDDYVSLLPNVTGSTAGAPSSFSNGQITCRIQHNYDSTTATQTAMACNYLGKGYNFTLQHKSHYREHEYDYENIRSSIRFTIDYSDGISYECSYIGGAYLVCPNNKGKTINKINFFNENTNSNLFFSTHMKNNFYYVNTLTSSQFNQIMQNDPTTYNNGIESIAGNTQLPNNSGLFDVLSSLSSFVGNLSASGSCNPISVPIPFTNQNLRLPCMTTEVYAPNFPVILGIYQLIVRGLVYYYIIVNMLKLLKDTIDPFSMKLEVLDL